MGEMSSSDASSGAPSVEELLKTQVMEERKFLHDVSSPVGTLMFLAEALGDALRERGVATAEDEEQLGILHKQLERVREMIVERRKTLHERSAVVGLPGPGGASKS